MHQSNIPVRFRFLRIALHLSFPSPPHLPASAVCQHGSSEEHSQFVVSSQGRMQEGDRRTPYHRTSLNNNYTLVTGVRTQNESLTEFTTEEEASRGGKEIRRKVPEGSRLEHRCNIRQRLYSILAASCSKTNVRTGSTVSKHDLGGLLGRPKDVEEDLSRSS